MYGNGAGTGGQVVITQAQKEVVTQLAPRRARAASDEVVVGATIRITALFLLVTTTTRTSAATTLAFVWCVPVLNKINLLL